MEYKQIKKLMDDMGESKLTALDIEFPDGIKISMKKDTSFQENETTKTKKQAIPTTEINVNATNEANVTTEAPEYKTIKAPMVGTFYSNPSPTAKPYVEVGTKVKKGDIVCIIEAMKLMNEIESEFDGKIAEILVKDGSPVEYGQPLFKII